MLLHFPIPSVPITPFQVWWSVSTLALESPRNMSLSVLGVAEITESRSGLVIVGALAVAIVACFIPDKRSLSVIRQSFMHIGSPESFLTRCDLMAGPTPASRRSSFLRPLQKNV